jgi:tRNA pseudouridine38-40 synthase
MVRSLVGTMAAVGQGKAAPSLLGDLLRTRERHLAGPTAPPQGLFLVAVEY